MRRDPGTVAFLSAALLFLLPALPAAARHAPGVGDLAPQYLGYGLDRKKVSLDTFAGKVVVISFWATWCPPCRQELPILENIQRAGKGYIQVVAINTESREVFRSAAKVLKDVTMLLTNDESQRGFDSYGAKGLPHMVVIGKDGHIISVREGYGSSELDAVVEELNAAICVGIAEGGASTPASSPMPDQPVSTSSPPATTDGQLAGK
jgi:thiol-disulfide isomerase/thioredoxin